MISTDRAMQPENNKQGNNIAKKSRGGGLLMLTVDAVK